MNRLLCTFLLGSALCATGFPASAEIIYRYNIGILGTSSEIGDPGTPGTPENPGTDNPTPPVTPPEEPESDEIVESPCEATQSEDFSFGCEVGEEKVSDDPTVSPLQLTMITPPPSANKRSFQYRCVRVSGGHGNYIFDISPQGNDALKVLDFVPFSTPNIATNGSSNGFWYPGYEDQYDIITNDTDFCLRLGVDKQVSFEEIRTRVWVGDYPDSVVENGRVNYYNNSYEAEKSVHLTFHGSSGVPEEEVVEECPADETDGPFNCEGVVDKSDPKNPIAIDFLPPPNDAGEDYHGYQCFRITGGEGNYAVTATTQSADWIWGLNILPYNSPNLAGSAGFNSSYPSRIDGMTTNLTNLQELCVRLTPEPAKEGDPPRGSAPVNVTISDYSASSMTGANQVTSWEEPTGSYTFKTSINGAIFTKPEGWIAMNFSEYRYMMEDITNGRIVQHIYVDEGSSSTVRGENFYYKCFIQTGGPASSFYYSMDPWLSHGWRGKPDWVEWADIRTPETLRSEYEWRDPDLPGSSEQYLPAGMKNSNERDTIANREFCWRVKPKAGSTSKEPYQVIIDVVHPHDNGYSYTTSQLVRMYWQAVPR